jgi:hypothetical protein
MSALVTGLPGTLMTLRRLTGAFRLLSRSSSAEAGIVVAASRQGITPATHAAVNLKRISSLPQTPYCLLRTPWIRQFVANQRRNFLVHRWELESLLRCILFFWHESAVGLVSRAPSVLLMTVRNYTGDEGRPFEFDNQVLISSHRKLL